MPLKFSSKYNKPPVIQTEDMFSSKCVIKWCSVMIISFCCLLCSCRDGNAVSFDFEENVLIAKDKRIQRVLIVNDSSGKTIALRWLGEFKEAPFFIDFSNVDASFHIEVDGEAVSTHTIPLEPLSKYTIERAGGDAGPFFLRIKTDSIGRVVSAVAGVSE